jgi:DNA-binding SARP family transcriptional activator
METLRITLFGQVSVVHPSVSAPLRLSRSTQALLAYLLLQRHLVPRDVLMDVFWVDCSPDRARSSLTTALWRLRHLLEPNDVQPGTYLITRNAGGVGFNWDSGHWLDTESFEQHVYPLLRKPVSDLGEDDIREIEGVLTLYRGELLEGVYDDWALREQERFRSLHLDCLCRLMEYYTGRKNFGQSIALAQEILRRDPVREEIHRALMRVYLDSGQRSLAIRQYAQCRELLDRELGVSPLDETQALYHQIVAASHPAAPAIEQPLTEDLAQLVRELERVKHSLHETIRAFEQIVQTVRHLANSREDVPVSSGNHRR